MYDTWPPHLVDMLNLWWIPIICYLFMIMSRGTGSVRICIELHELKIAFITIHKYSVWQLPGLNFSEILPALQFHNNIYNIAKFQKQSKIQTMSFNSNFSSGYYQTVKLTRERHASSLFSHWAKRKKGTPYIRLPGRGRGTSIHYNSCSFK